MYILSVTDYFAASKTGYVATFCQLVLSCLLLLIHYHPSKPILVQFSVWALHWATNITILIQALFKNSKSYTELFSNAHDKYLLLPANSKIMPFKMYICLLLLPIAPFAFVLPFFWKIPGLFIFSIILLAYGYQPLVGTEISVSCLCFISEQLYDASRKNICKLKAKPFSNKLFIKLTNELDSYVKANNFTYKVTQFYGPFFAVIFFSFLFRVILYSFMLINFFKGKATGTTEMKIIVAFHSVYLFIRIIFLCYRCHQVEDKVMYPALNKNFYFFFVSFF